MKTYIKPLITVYYVSSRSFFLGSSQTRAGSTTLRGEQGEVHNQYEGEQNQLAKGFSFPDLGLDDSFPAWDD